MLARDIHLVAQLLDTSSAADDLTAVVAHLQPLSGIEFDITAAMRHEFRFLHATMTTTAYSNLHRDGFPGWMQRFVYKPNATLNEIFRRYEALATISSQATRKRHGALREQSFFGWPLIWRMPYNFVGTVLARIADPVYHKFLGRVVDLEGLIRLVHLKYEIRANNVRSEQIPSLLEQHREDYGDPYTNRAMRWDAAREVIYFNGADERRWLYEIGVPSVVLDIDAGNAATQ